MAVYWFLPGVLIGALLVWVYGQYGSIPRSTASVPTSENSLTQPEEKFQTNHSIEIGDQPAGYAVVVDKVELADTSWIAVREQMSDGTFGNILGAARRDAGSLDRVVVDLLRPTEPDRHYVITEYIDDGDKLFDSKKDTQIMDNNKPLTSPFRALLPVGPGGQ